MYAKYHRLFELPKPLTAAGAALLAGLLAWGSDSPWLTGPVALACLLAGVYLDNITGRLAGLGVTANQLTLAGLALSILAVWPLAGGRLTWGLLIALVGATLDLADGHLARRSNAAGPKGAVLDSVADRASDGALMIGLALYLLGRGQTGWLAVCLIGLVGSFLVSYTRAKAEIYLDDCSVGWGGERPNRLIALIVTGLVGWLEVGLVYVALFSWLTALRRLQYTWRRL